MIGPDATIADVWPTLTDPEKFVSKVLWLLYDCYREHDNASVRIDTKGSEDSPSFRIWYTDPKTGKAEVFGSYTGTGAPVAAGSELVAPEDWSSLSWTMEELLAFDDEKNPPE